MLERKNQAASYRRALLEEQLRSDDVRAVPLTAKVQNDRDQRAGPNCHFRLTLISVHVACRLLLIGHAGWQAKGVPTMAGGKTFKRDQKRRKEMARKLKQEEKMKKKMERREAKKHGEEGGEVVPGLDRSSAF